MKIVERSILSWHASNMAPPTSRADFESVFPSLTQDLVDHAKKYNMPENALAWFEKVFLDMGEWIELKNGWADC